MAQLLAPGLPRLCVLPGGTTTEEERAPEDRVRLSRPTSLREFLTGGSELGEADIFIEGLAELLFVDLFTLPAELLAERATADRHSVEQLLGDTDATWAEPHQRSLERFIRLALWSCEAVADPELADLARCAMPPAVVDDYRRLLDLTKRPHPLELAVPQTWWRCANCGTVFDPGECQAVAIGYRPGFSELDYEIRYCTACVARASAGAGVLS